MKSFYISLTKDGQFLSASKAIPSGSHIGRFVYLVASETRDEAIVSAKARFANGESSDTPHGLKQGKTLCDIFTEEKQSS